MCVRFVRARHTRERARVCVRVCARVRVGVCARVRVGVCVCVCVCVLLLLGSLVHADDQSFSLLITQRQQQQRR